MLGLWATLAPSDTLLPVKIFKAPAGSPAPMKNCASRSAGGAVLRPGTTMTELPRRRKDSVRTPKTSEKGHAETVSLLLNVPGVCVCYPWPVLVRL